MIKQFAFALSVTSLCGDVQSAYALRSAIFEEGPDRRGITRSPLLRKVETMKNRGLSLQNEALKITIVRRSFLPSKLFGRKNRSLRRMARIEKKTRIKQIRAKKRNSIKTILANKGIERKKARLTRMEKRRIARKSKFILHRNNISLAQITPSIEELREENITSSHQVSTSLGSFDNQSTGSIHQVSEPGEVQDHRATQHIALTPVIEIEEVPNRIEHANSENGEILLHSGVNIELESAALESGGVRLHAEENIGREPLAADNAGGHLHVGRDIEPQPVVAENEGGHLHAGATIEREPVAAENGGVHPGLNVELQAVALENDGNHLHPVLNTEPEVAIPDIQHDQSVNIESHLIELMSGVKELKKVAKKYNIYFSPTNDKEELDSQSAKLARLLELAQQVKESISEEYLGEQGALIEIFRDSLDKAVTKLAVIKSKFESYFPQATPVSDQGIDDEVSQFHVLNSDVSDSDLRDTQLESAASLLQELSLGENALRNTMFSKEDDLCEQASILDNLREKADSAKSGLATFEAQLENGSGLEIDDIFALKGRGDSLRTVLSDIKSHLEMQGQRLNYVQAKREVEAQKTAAPAESPQGPLSEDLMERVVENFLGILDNLRERLIALDPDTDYSKSNLQQERKNYLETAPRLIKAELEGIKRILGISTEDREKKRETLIEGKTLGSKLQIFRIDLENFISVFKLNDFARLDSSIISKMYIVERFISAFVPRLSELSSPETPILGEESEDPSEEKWVNALDELRIGLSITEKDIDVEKEKLEAERKNREEENAGSQSEPQSPDSPLAPRPDSPLSRELKALLSTVKKMKKEEFPVTFTSTRGSGLKTPTVRRPGRDQGKSMMAQPAAVSLVGEEEETIELFSDPTKIPSLETRSPAVSNAKPSDDHVEQI
ncbi:MAG: hypothetical protein BGO67_11240 [Alphaproteobacteria bacterium 41-28]|nr:MAG: hypothetical protein BGO67_11240 [Alphaproteobacteria bacterium 41-28]